MNFDIIHPALCAASPVFIEVYGRAPGTQWERMSYAATAVLRPLGIHLSAWKDADRSELPEPTSVAFISEVHRRFYVAMPEEFNLTELGSVWHEIIPGMFRTSAHEVAVGHHRRPNGFPLSWIIMRCGIES